MIPTSSFISRPTLNFTTFFAGTLTFSRVRGFWALRAARSLISKTPNSRNSSRLPLPSSLMISSRNIWMTSFVTTFVWPVFSAMRLTSSFFVTVAIGFVPPLREGSPVLVASGSNALSSEGPWGYREHTRRPPRVKPVNPRRPSRP